MDSIDVGKLEDHEPFAAAIRRQAELSAALQETRNELGSLGEPHTGSTSILDDDLDKAVDHHQRAIEAHGKKRLKLEMRAAALTKMIEEIELLLPELRREAEDLIGREGSEQHAKAVERFETARAELIAAVRQERKIRMAITTQLNRTDLPAFGGWSAGERFTSGPVSVALGEL